MQYNNLRNIYNNIISDCPFGFRANPSIRDAITSLANHIYIALDEMNYTLELYIRYPKAFDTVNHKLLFDKLGHNGMSGTSKAYISNREQFV